MASPVYLWYTSEVFYWRSLASSCWSIICLPFLLFLYLFLSSISMVHPIVWCTDALSNTVSLKFMLAVFFFGMSVIVVTWFSLPYFNVKPRIDSSKLASILGLFHWSRLTLLIICILNGVLAGWSLAFLAGPEYDSLSTVYSIGGSYREVSRLNEKHLFLVGCGLFTGFCHFCQFFTHKKYHLTFPNIQRLKLFQTRSDLISLIFSTFWKTLHIMKYFYILYFLFGGLPRFWIDHFFGLALDTVPLDSIFGLFDAPLAWQSFLISYLITFAWSMTLTLTRIFHAEHLEFPIITTLEDMRGKTLVDALACSYSPLLQHLAFLDLAWLTKYSTLRMQELLSLSQPGGHPKIWVSISELVLSEIWKLTSCIRDTNFTILSKVPVNPHQNGVVHTTPYGNFDTTVNPSVRSRAPDALSNGVNGKEREISQKRGLIPKWFQTSSRLPLLSQLLTESPDTNSQQLFAECQLQIWAVESLSNVVVRAYTEDKYGVVQGSLYPIFSSLLDLNESMEKHFKLTSVTSRRQNSSEISSETLLRYKLHSVLKSALYRMVNTYRSHLYDLHLSPEETKKLSPFIDYTA